MWNISYVNWNENMNFTYSFMCSQKFTIFKATFKNCHLEYCRCTLYYNIIKVDMHCNSNTDTDSNTLPLVSQERTKSPCTGIHTQVALFLWGSPILLRGKPLMLFLLSVVVPEQNNCTAFVCFPHLLPLSRLKATDFVWAYKIERDIFQPIAFN